MGLAHVRSFHQFRRNYSIRVTSELALYLPCKPLNEVLNRRQYGVQYRHLELGSLLLLHVILVLSF